jgi:hypothetical protein
MRHRHLIPLLLALAALLGASVAQGELSQKGNLRISFDGGFTPRALPRERPVPVTLSVEGSIGTTDGSRPPAMKQFEIELNRHGHLSTRGLPVCSTPLLQSTTSEAALARCRPALVGEGSFAAAVESGGKLIPASGRILAFNGTFHRVPAVILHFYTAVPARVTLILPLEISHQPQGQFGTVLSARIPTLAGGLASITKVNLKIHREYRYRGQRLGFISASCAAPAGFPGAIFPFARGNFHFVDGRTIVTKLTRNCRVRSGS